MGTPALWVGFNLCVLLILAIDLGLFNRKAHAITLREAAIWSAVWVTLSLSFNVWIFLAHGRQPGVEFLTAYLIEQSLSMDNIFVFLLIFRAFGIESRFQHRVLFWGVLGAIVLRGSMIALGTVLVPPSVPRSVTVNVPAASFQRDQRRHYEARGRKSQVDFSRIPGSPGPCSHGKGSP